MDNVTWLIFEGGIYSICVQVCRKMVTIKNKEDFEAKKSALQQVIKQWLAVVEK